jgi:hypothetical protein
MPVEIFARPWPSRFKRTRMSVSVVVRRRLAFLIPTVSPDRERCAGFSAPPIRAGAPRGPVRVAAVREYAKKRDARAFGGERVVDVISEIERIAARRAVSSRSKPSGSGLPFFTSSMVTARRKISFRVRALERVAQFLPRAARKERQLGAARPALQPLVRDEPAFARDIARDDFVPQ